MTDFDSWFDQLVCPHCGTEDCIPVYGHEKSPILIIGAYPGYEELRKGIPMVGPMGIALNMELRRLRVNLKQCRRGNLWLHKPNSREDCLAYSTDIIIKEAQGKKAILIMGKDPVNILLNKKVSDIEGILTTSPYLSAPIIVGMQNPAVVFHGTVGETRLSLQKFVDACKKEGVL